MAKFTGYTPDQPVEVYETDFKTAGYPKVWRSGTVLTVAPFGDPAKGLSAVGIHLHHDGRVVSIIVGPRGGGREVRPAN